MCAERRSRARRAALVAGVALLATARVGADAPAGRYELTPPVVSDTATGLTWMMAVPTTGGDDGAGGYAWANAGAYCPTVGAGWRLPTLKELLTLVDVSSSAGPTIDGAAFPDTPAEGFWSSTRSAGTTNIAWFVTFGYGGTGNDFVTHMYRVRCVR